MQADGHILLKAILVVNDGNTVRISLSKEGAYSGSHHLEKRGSSWEGWSQGSHAKHWPSHLSALYFPLPAAWASSETANRLAGQPQAHSPTAPGEES